MEETDIKHIAFIMDGNGRWAKKRLLPRAAGHKEGLKAIETVTERAFEQGVPYLSFFAFSTENWARPQKEVDSLMQLLKDKLPSIAQKTKNRDAVLTFTGDLSPFDTELKDVIAAAKDLTKDGRCGTINICLNYGGRNEIVNAVNTAVERGVRVTEGGFKRLLYTSALPDPDLLIRTGGERRLSNFMLYQLAYTELYFTPTLWPDFSAQDFDTAIADYKNRTRRFGKV